MSVPTNSAKYVSVKCRRKIPAEDLNDIFESQLDRVELSSDNSREENLSNYWPFLTQKEKRIIIEQICDRVTIGDRRIDIELGYLPNSPKTVTFGQRIEKNDKTDEVPFVEPKSESIQPIFHPLLSEAEAADFIGVSRMTMLRKRNAGIVGFYRVGSRVLYSREKHLIPFLEGIEQRS